MVQVTLLQTYCTGRRQKVKERRVPGCDTENTCGIHIWGTLVQLEAQHVAQKRKMAGNLPKADPKAELSPPRT